MVTSFQPAPPGKPAQVSPTPASDPRGFTIVELLIVILVIGILSALVLVAYNGIRTKAEDVSLQSETRQALAKVLAYKALNSDKLPADLTSAGFAAGSGRDAYYRLTPDGNDFCLAVNITGSAQRVFSATSTDPVPKRGTCEGYILVPSNAALGTSDFWVMKYEAKNVSGVATSQAANTPWVSISQTDAISTSATACDGCHLISEAEWMTLAGNVLGVGSNWSGGSAGSGYIFNGHNDNNPANALVASSTDSDGYNGTGNSTGSNQRRTLALSNGEVVWDVAGNVAEWTSSVVEASGIGVAGDSGFTWRNWTSGSLSFGTLPEASRPSVLASTPALASVVDWNAGQGVGQIYANGSDISLRALVRGGSYYNLGSSTGVLALNLAARPTAASMGIGVRCRSW